MGAQVVVLAGPAGTGKTARVLEKYHQVVCQAEPGMALWLAPNWRGVEEVRRRLLSRRGGYLAPGLMTFDRFAEAVVEFSGRKARLIEPQMKWYLIRQLVQERRTAEKFHYFTQIADTPGFVDLLTDWIREMKRLEIWPEQFRQACQARGMQDKDRELLEIYEAYQRLLTEQELYDAEGRFWLARSLLAEGALLPPAQRQRLQLVVVDGFTDFTRTQHEILEHLASRVEEMVITLPLEREPGRKELFAKPGRTLQQIQNRHSRVQVEWLERSSQPVWPALDHIERYLFANPRQYRPLAQKAERIEIVAAASALGEVELLAKRIKRLLTEGDPNADGGPVAPEDILVIFRSLEPVEGLVREVFGRYGIAYALETAPPLRSARSLMALMEWVQLHVEDWPFRRLLAVLNHSYFQPDWPEWQNGRAALAADRVIRWLQIPQGRENLLEALRRRLRHQDNQIGQRDPGLESLASNSETPGSETIGGIPLEEGGHSPPPCRQEVKMALALLSRAAEALDALPCQATLSGWARAYRHLAEQVGIFRAIPTAPSSASWAELPSRGEQPASEGLEHLAWEELLKVLESADRVWSWVGQPAPELDQKEALNVLIDVLSSHRLPWEAEEAGRVRVVSARTARPLRTSYVFLAGLSEKAFPPPEPVDRFYNDRETQELIERGLPLAARRDHSCEEMLLFYEAMTRATRHLVLSYPGLDESAQPLASSPYLEEVEAVCGAGQIEKKELFELRPIPDSGELFCWRDFRVRAMANAMDADVALLAGLLQSAGPTGSPGPVFSSSGRKQSRGSQATASLFDLQDLKGTDPLCRAEESFGLGENIFAAVRLTADRSDIDQFGPAEGMLQTAAALADLQKRFGTDHVYSATALEQYAFCPFRFLWEGVLKLRVVEELELEEDYAKRGWLAHQILASVHRRINDRLGRPSSPSDLEEADWQRFLQEATEETFATRPGEPVRAALYEVHRRVICNWLADYRERHQIYDEQQNKHKEISLPLRPTYFEVAFGRSNPPTPYGCLELILPLASEDDVKKVRISGRIDRIDVGKMADHVVFNVLDYKTGEISWPNQKKLQEQLETGVLLQLPLYLLAVQKIILADQQPTPWFAGYWRIKATSKSPVSGFYAAQLEKGKLLLDPQWEWIEQTIQKVVFRLVRALRSGQFPVYSPEKNCTRSCPWKTACRIQQVRALEKKWVL